MDDSHTFFWLVGILEGEGTFLWYPSSGKTMIEMEGKDEHVVARVAALWQVSYFRRDRRHRNPRSSVTYQVRLTGARAIQLMIRLKEYMSPRRQRAIEHVLSCYSERNGSPGAQARVRFPTLLDVPYAVVYPAAE